MTTRLPSSRGRSRHRKLLGTALVAVAATAAGCGGADDGKAGQQDAAGVSVVASTNVWGSVVRAVGGDQVAVSSIIDASDGDPHSYESTPADSAEVNDAQLVVYNGGGYDDFFTGLAEQAPDARRIVAFDVSGKGGEDRSGTSAHQDDSGHQTEESGHQEDPGHEDESGHAHESDHAHETGQGQDSGHGHNHGHGHGGVNEHVWYDLPSVSKVAEEVAAALSEIKPSAEQTFERNAERFTGKLDDLRAEAEKIGSAAEDGRILATAPVAHYLTETTGLTDATPEDYIEAIESQRDVPPATVATVNKLISEKKVTAVLNNTQTETPTTQDLVRRANEAGVPVVGMTETLPQDATGYVDWMSKQVNALSKALGRE